MAPHRRDGYDLLLAVGLLRYAFQQTVDETATVLSFAGRSRSRATVARLGRECLVRWAMLCEERLPARVRFLPTWVPQIDGTVEEGGPVTFRAREAFTGVTLLARQLVSENKEEVVGFLRELRAKYGVPRLGMRDLSVTLREAWEVVYPGVPQAEDHWHALDDVGPKMLVDYEPTKEALVARHGLSDLAAWSRELPLRGRTVEVWEQVGVRLALEWMDGARAHPGGFPWRLAYLEVGRRLRWVREWAEAMVRGNVRRGWFVPEVVTLRDRVGRVLAREGVQLHLGRLESEAQLWDEVRRAMRMDRSSRRRMPLGPMTRGEVETAKEEITEAGNRFRTRGDWAVAIWERVAQFFREHAPYLWVAAEVAGLPRTTVDLERAHGEERRRIRRRTGQKDTGGEMGRVGALLAWSSNLRNRWFVEEVLSGVNVAEEFAQQDAGEVRRRLEELPREGRRPKVRVTKGTERRHLERLRELVSGEGPVEPALHAWAVAVAAHEGSVN